MKKKKTISLCSTRIHDFHHHIFTIFFFRDCSHFHTQNFSISSEPVEKIFFTVYKWHRHFFLFSSGAFVGIMSQCWVIITVSNHQSFTYPVVRYFPLLNDTAHLNCYNTTLPVPSQFFNAFLFNLFTNLIVRLFI